MKKLLASLLILGVSVAPALAVPGRLYVYSPQVNSYFKKPVAKRKSAPNPMGIYTLWANYRPGVFGGSCSVANVTPTSLLYSCIGLWYNPSVGQNVTVTTVGVFKASGHGNGYFTSK